MGGVHFDGGLHPHRFERELARMLDQGRLPGGFGLVQSLVDAWAFPKAELTPLRVGKAILDSVGSVLEFRESRRETVEGEASPTLGWLRREGYTAELGKGSQGLSSFARGVLAGLEFRDRRVRSDLGELDRAVLKEFELGKDARAFLLDPWGAERQTFTTNETLGWLGPFCRPEEQGLLEVFLRERVWRDRLTSKTALLDVQAGDLDSDSIRLDALSDDFEFASASEAFNDVESLALRCAAFLFAGRSRRLLFHGPPGTGKSTLARAIARHLQVRTILLGQEATSSLDDASLLKILALLEPGLLVLNDIDRTGEHEALALLHGLEALVDQPLVAVLTANDVDTLDPALLRPGRIDEIRGIPEPNKESRRTILEHYARRYQLDLGSVLTESVLERSEGFSPADLREFAEIAQAMGLEVALEEVERIAEQRKLYAGERCSEFNHRRRGGRRPRMRRFA